MTMETTWLRGCATALVTPFTAGGAVDETRLREVLSRVRCGGYRQGGSCLCGTFQAHSECARRRHRGRGPGFRIPTAAAKGSAKDQPVQRRWALGEDHQRRLDQSTAEINHRDPA